MDRNTESKRDRQTQNVNERDVNHSVTQQVCQALVSFKPTLQSSTPI